MIRNSMYKIIKSYEDVLLEEELLNDIYQKYSETIELIKSNSSNLHFEVAKDKMNSLSSKYILDLETISIKKNKLIKAWTKFSFSNYNFPKPPQDNLELKRADMPQLNWKDCKAFLKYLELKGVKVTIERIKNTDLSPAQKEIDDDKITNILEKYINDIEKKKLYQCIVSQDNYIVDGTHRWAATIQIKQGMKIKALKIHLSTTELLEEMMNFKVKDNLTPKNTLENKIGALAFIKNTKGEFLILKRSNTDPWMPNKWYLPGGTKDNNEVPYETLLREVKEEIGVDLSNKDIYCAGHIYGDQYLTFTYVIELNDVDCDIKLSNEHSDYMWVTEDDLNELSNVVPFLFYHLKNYVDYENMIGSLEPIQKPINLDVLNEYFRMDNKYITQPHDYVKMSNYAFLQNS